MSRPGLVFASVAVLAAGLMLLGPVLAHPTTHVLGTWDSEAAWHMWRHGAWLRTFATEGPWVRAHEDGLADPNLANLSPASTLLVWPAWRVVGGGIAGVAFAWNILYAMVYAGAVAGTWMLVRAWLPKDKSCMAAAAATAIVAFGAFLHQTPAVGRQENIVQFLWPLHLAFLYRATVRPRRAFDPPLAVVTFAVLAMQGGFPALFTAIVEVPAALWCLAQSTERKRASAILALVAVAGVAALYPWIHANRLYPPAALAEGRLGTISVPLAQLLPGGGDVPFIRGWHEAPYPGSVAILVALVAAVMHRASRFWLLLALGVMLLMIGPEARWTVDAIEPLAEMPVAWLARLPGWSVPPTGWARLGTFVPTLLALAIAPALVGRPRVAALVACLAIADQVVYVRSVPETETSWDLALPPGLGDPHRPSVWLPLDERGLTWLHAAPPELRRYPFEEHNTLATLRWIEGVLPGTPAGFLRTGRSRRGGDSPLPGCVARDAGVMAAAGFARLVLLRDHGDATEVERVLRAGLGEPVADTDRGAAWTLVSAPEAICDVAIGPVQRREPVAHDKPKHAGGEKHYGRGRRSRE